MSILSCYPTKSTVEQNSPAPLEDQSISDIEWQLITIGLAKVKSNTTIVFDLKSHKFKGNAPCNSYGGKYTVQRENIDLSALYSTEMACDDLKIESLYFRRLTNQEVTTSRKTH